MKITYKGLTFDNKDRIIQGKDLKVMRLLADVTTSVAAASLGVKSRKTVENWEAGKSQPNINKFINLCHYYGFNPALVIKASLQRAINPETEEHEVSLNFEACRLKS